MTIVRSIDYGTVVRVIQAKHVVVETFNEKSDENSELKHIIVGR